MRCVVLAVYAPLMAAAWAAPTDAQPGSISIAAKGGEIVHMKADGYADIENGVPVAPNTVFRLASLTKQFTAVAILALAQDQRLSLDDEIRTRLRDCPPAWAAITIRQLLSHTSGLTGDMTPVYARLKDDFTPRELLALYVARAPEAAPGAQWRYSNLNYWILGQVIEDVTAQSYVAFVTSRVIEPAGLTATRYGSNGDIIVRRAHGYTKTGDGRWRNAPYFSASIGYAAGGFVSTATDMAQWYDALSAGKIVNRNLIDLAAAEVHIADGRSVGYGLGWYIAEHCGVRVLHHGGSSPGFSAYIYWIPKMSLFAAVFANHDHEGEPKDRARDLLPQLRCSDANGPRRRSASPAQDGRLARGR